MNLSDVMEKIKDIKSRKEKLKNELFDMEREEEDMVTFLNICATFDESLIKIISDLMTQKEKEGYIPFMYKSYSSLFTNSAYSVENTCVGITKYTNIPMFNRTKNVEELFKQEYGYNMICLKTELLEKETEVANPYIGLYNISKDYSGKIFTFEFLLDEIDSSAFALPVRICKSNFNECPYIRDYIRYVFDLQVQRNGKRLNYEEMKKSVEEFNKLINNKLKIKKLINNDMDILEQED